MLAVTAVKSLKTRREVSNVSSHSSVETGDRNTESHSLNSLLAKSKMINCHISQSTDLCQRLYIFTLDPSLQVDGHLCQLKSIKVHLQPYFMLEKPSKREVKSSSALSGGNEDARELIALSSWAKKPVLVAFGTVASQWAVLVTWDKGNLPWDPSEHRRPPATVSCRTSVVNGLELVLHCSAEICFRDRALKTESAIIIARAKPQNLSHKSKQGSYADGLRNNIYKKLFTST